jgi:hypothetical protein
VYTCALPWLLFTGSTLSHGNIDTSHEAERNHEYRAWQRGAAAGSLAGLAFGVMHSKLIHSYARLPHHTIIYRFASLGSHSLRTGWQHRRRGG